MAGTCTSLIVAPQWRDHACWGQGNQLPRSNDRFSKRPSLFIYLVAKTLATMWSETLAQWNHRDCFLLNRIQRAVEKHLNDVCWLHFDVVVKDTVQSIVSTGQGQVHSYIIWLFTRRKGGGSLLCDDEDRISPARSIKRERVFRAHVNMSIPLWVSTAVKMLYLIFAASFVVLV